MTNVLCATAPLKNKQGVEGGGSHILRSVSEVDWLLSTLASALTTI